MQSGHEMINYSEIKDVHLEISSLCNARCPLCPRNFKGYPYNDGYTEANLTLAQAKSIFSIEFLQQLNSVWINGNFGDAVMNPETLDIVEYFNDSNPLLRIDISTNGGARDADFWRGLAGKAIISFCIDGLEDTHHLYRQNTSWQTVIKNAQSFIDAGGKAIWKMIRFKHNQHQIAECERLSKSMGFFKFVVADDGRNSGPVFDKDGDLVHVMGDYTGITDFNVLFHKKKTDILILEDITPSSNTSVSCFSKTNKSIYITSTGDVYPCCWLGFNPTKFGHGEYLQVVNSQIAPLVKENNALEKPLEECLKWFSSVEESWHKETYKQGKLVACFDNCGKK